MLILVRESRPIGEDINSYPLFEVYLNKHYNRYNSNNEDVRSMEQIERKVTKIGNSIGITLPPEVLRQVGIARGDDVQVEVKDGKIILQKKEHLQLPDGVDAEFMGILNDVVKEHDKAFKGLVDR